MLTTMDLAARKWSIMERLSLITDAKAIARIEQYVESQLAGGRPDFG
jgi:hypothetical protein